MKKLKYLFLMICLVLGITGCAPETQGYVDMDVLKQELQEYVDTDVLQEEIGKYINTDNIKDFVQSEFLNKYFQQGQQDIAVPEGEMVVHFIDVGQADCILLASGGHFMLIDGGNNEDGDRIVSYLKNVGVKKLDIVVGTHPHEDHIGALDTAIHQFDVGAVYMPDAAVDTTTYRDVISAVKKKGLKVQNPKSGDVLDFNGIPVEVFAPVKEYRNVNNSSIVMRVSVGDTAFLFTGDVETDAEFDILEKGYDISADVLKVSHHGSSGSSVEEFLAYVDADYAVISVGKGNTYDHPEEVTLNRLKNYGMKIFRTDEQGTIICSTDGKNISFVQEGSSSQTGEVKNAEFIGNKKTLKYHLSNCKSLPIEKNRAYFADRASAVEMGYAPCGTCKP